MNILFKKRSHKKFLFIFEKYEFLINFYIFILICTYLLLYFLIFFSFFFYSLLKSRYLPFTYLPSLLCYAFLNVFLFSFFLFTVYLNLDNFYIFTFHDCAVYRFLKR